jgi:hypothetical protein
MIDTFFRDDGWEGGGGCLITSVASKATCRATLIQYCCIALWIGALGGLFGILIYERSFAALLLKRWFNTEKA